MKSLLKKITSMATVMAVSATSATMQVSAADALPNPCNLQDNREAPYVDYYSPNQYTTIIRVEAAQSAVKPRITIDKIELTLEEAKANPVQTVNFVLEEGAENKIATIGLHPIWDTRMTPKPNNNRYLKRGNALEEFLFEENTGYLADGYLTFAAMSSYESNTSGTLFSIDFEIPANAEEGDVYPIGIRYQNKGYTSDQFTGVKWKTSENQLMEAYTFTQGITNGYIKIKGEPDFTTGDVNDDGMINSIDASLVLAEYAVISTGGTLTFSPDSKRAADVNNDGKYDSADASKILSYYAMDSTGKEPTWD